MFSALFIVLFLGEFILILVYLKNLKLLSVLETKGLSRTLPKNMTIPTNLNIILSKNQNNNKTENVSVQICGFFKIENWRF
jgi:hypothetical protein